MAKQGLIRIPYYPQLSCLQSLHPQAPLVMSALLFWMSRNQTTASYCEQRHNYQLSLHLGLDYSVFVECMRILHEQHLFIQHSVILSPKEKTADSKEKEEIRLSLDFTALQQLLHHLGSDIKLKLLLHAADDSFDIYDVIDDKKLPLVQVLHGHLEGETYLKAAVEACRFLIYVNEHCENLAASAIAPGWKLLLALPMGMSEEEYAVQLATRFTRPQEKAIDFNLMDGTFFLPAFEEIQGEVHSIKHYRKHPASMTFAAALMLHLAEHFGKHLYFTSELSVEQLYSAFMVCREINGRVPVLAEQYYAERRLSLQQIQAEQQLYKKISQQIMAEP